MMGLAGYAQRTGIFGWVADRAVRIAGTSRLRLFALVYGAGIVTTAFFSNDATIVVLTPAVIDALRRFDASPVPYVVACALIANAASFLLPISNPSNLLVFAGRIPSLGAWLALFIVPSIVAIAVTYAIVWWFYRSDLAGAGAHVTRDAVHAPDPLAIAVLAASAAVIVATSALAGPLGAVTFACAAVALAITIVRDAPGALKIVREISWRVIVLTALLFVVVTALDDRGGFAFSRSVLTTAANYGAPWASLATARDARLDANGDGRADRREPRTERNRQRIARNDSLAHHPRTQRHPHVVARLRRHRPADDDPGARVRAHRRRFSLTTPIRGRCCRSGT